MRTRQTRGMLLLAALLVAFLTYTFAQYKSSRKRLEETRQAQSLERNVYIITASGLRSDHLSINQYQHSQTPAIDFLLNDGVRFTSAFSTSPESLSAHLSLLTGLYPFRAPVHKTLEYWYHNKHSRVPPRLKTLPSLFQKRQYLTAAFLSDPELRFPTLFNNFFEDVFYGDQKPRRWRSSYSVSQVSKLARDWVLKNKTKHQFLLLNFNEPTLPFDPPAPFNGHYTNYPYDGEVAALDEEIGLFINMLKASGLFQRSIVILTAPFTESLDGSVRSGSLEDVTLRIPLLIAAPGMLPRQQRYDHQVSIVDIAPTILALFGWNDDQPVDGLPLFKKDSRQEISREFVFAQTRLPELFGFSPSFMVRNSRSRLVEPGQMEVTPDQDPMRKSLTDELEKENLPHSFQQVPPPFDPGILIERARNLAFQKHPALAFDLIDSFRGEVSPSPALLRIMGDLTIEAGDPDAASQLYNQAFSASKNREILPSLAYAQMLAGNWKEARDALQLYQAGNQDLSYDIYSMMGTIELDSGEGDSEPSAEKAIPYLNRAIELNPRSADSFVERGRAYAGIRRNEEAISDFSRAIKLDPQLTSANWFMAMALIQSSKKKEAIPYLRQLIELNPENYRAALELAAIHQQLGNRKEALRLCQTVILKSQDESLRQKAKAIIAQ